jgi:hypothetical protein
MLNGLTDPSKKKLVQVYIVPKAVDKSQRKRNQISVNTIHNYRWQDLPIAICRDLSRCQMVSFSDQKSQRGHISEDLGMGNADIHSLVIWNFLRALGIFHRQFGNFVVILINCTKKNLATLYAGKS